MGKKLLSGMLALCVLLTLLPAEVLATETETVAGEVGSSAVARESLPEIVSPVLPADPADASSCGENLTWAMDSAGTLLISGSGPMNDYYDKAAPWFELNKSITAVNFEGAVTSIGDCAFSLCSKLVSVHIPDSVTRIGTHAFSGCSALSDVKIPNGVTHIGEYAFGSCSSLTDMIIPESVTTIGAGAFNACSGLTSIVIPKRVKTIETGVFSRCGGLTSVTIPESVTSIGNSAFEKCTNLSAVVIPGNVTSIHGYAFSQCSKLSSITIPESVTDIGDSAFSYCYELTSVTIPSSVTTIGWYVFGYCKGLTSVTIPASVTAIKESAFSGCAALTDVYYGGTRAQWNEIAIADSNEPFINAAIHCTDDIKSRTVTFNPNGGSGTTNVQTFTGDAVQNLNANTFERPGYRFVGWNTHPDGSGTSYRDRQSVILNTNLVLYAQWTDLPLTIVASGNCGINGDNLTWTLDSEGTLVISGSGNMAEPGYDIDVAWYNERNSITEVRFKGAVNSIGSYAFSYCNRLTSIAIPDNVTSIGDGAFKYCSELIRVTIPDSVDSIGGRYQYGAGAFAYCGKLRNIVLPDSISVIYEETFLDCVSLTGVTIPGTVSEIQDAAFAGCSSLTEVDIPYGVTGIGSAVFSGCTALERVSIPESVSSIGAGAFYMCERLDHVTLPSGVTAIEKNTFYGTGLTDITLPASLTHIGRSAFLDCTALREITIPNRVSSIGDSAFEGCSSLEAVALPPSVTSIGDDAFFKCSSLNRVTVPTSVSKIGFAAFSGCDSLLTAGPIGGGYNFEFGWTDVIPEKLLSIASLVSITLPDTVVHLADGAFYGCGSLKHINIPSGVTRLGKNLFRNCASLETFQIPSHITGIGESAFEGCTGLTDVVIPDSVKTIESRAFAMCTSLKNIRLPNGLAGISEYMFWNCQGLEDITLPGSVTRIEESAFMGCVALKDLPAGGSVAFIGDSAFCACDSLISITIPDGVETIDPWAFLSCDSLIHAALPAGVTVMKAGLFRDCAKLKSVTIPGSVKQIERFVFDDCGSLSDIYYGGSEAQWSAISLDSSNNEALGRAVIHYNSTGPEVVVGRICFESDSLCIEPGEPAEIGVHLPKDNGLTWEDLTVTSSEPKIAEPVKIEDWPIGALVTVKGLANGTARLTLTASDGRSAFCKVTVGNGISAEAFDPDVYRADHLQNASNPDVEAIWDVLGSNTPCGIYIPELQKNNFDTYAAAWTAFTKTVDALDKPSSLYDFAVEEKDVYTAIILDMLNASSSFAVINPSAEAVYKDISSLVTKTNGLFKAEFGLDLLAFDMKALTPDQQDWLVKFVGDLYKDGNPLAAASDAFSVVSDVLEYGGDAESYIKRVFSVFALRELSDSLKTVLETMYEQCPSSVPALKLALWDCTQIIQAGESEVYGSIVSGGLAVAGVDVAKYMADTLWKNVRKGLGKAYPVTEMLLAVYKADKFICNNLFNTDSTIEQYCVMQAVVEVENLSAASLEVLRKNYLASKTAETAGAYLGALDILFAARDHDCESACTFVDVLDDALVNRIAELFNQSAANQREQIKKYFRETQSNFAQSHGSALANWVNYLPDDYPGSGLYEKYYYLVKRYEKGELSKTITASSAGSVFVYDQENRLVACAANGKLLGCEGVTVVQDGDTSTLYFSGGEDYRVEYSADGPLDLVITEVNEKTGVSRDVYFYDVPLEGGSCTTSLTAQANQTYTLSGSGGTVTPVLDTASPSAQKRTIRAASGGIRINEELTAEAGAYPGQQVSISAYVPSNMEFDRWTCDCEDAVFSDASAASTSLRMPDGDITITAVLRPKSAVENVSILNGRILVELKADYVGAGRLIAAAYGDNGKLLRIAAAELSSAQVPVNLDPAGAAYIKIFTADETAFTPIGACRTEVLSG